MKKGLIEVVYILDKSGSMYELTDDTIGGYNSLIDESKKLDAEIVVTTVLFNSSVETIASRCPINDVALMDNKTYRTGGCTAMLDAIGMTIDNIDNAHKLMADDELPEKVLVYITTDGYENASKEYSYNMINKMIEWHKKYESWEFKFMAANIDEKEVGKAMGLEAKEVVGYKADKRSTRKLYKSVMYDCLCQAVAESKNK